MPLHIETSGDGSDLVLLHGWGMHSGIWNNVRGELARHFRVHAVDLPGYGESPACEPYTLAMIADMLAHALPEAVNVCGWSMGALLAQTWALRHPAQVARLTLVAGTPCFAARSDWPHGINADILREFSENLARDYDGTLKRFLSLQARGDKQAKEVMVDLRRQLFARGRPTQCVLEAGLRILLDTDLRAQSEHIKQPALLIHGARDLLAPLGAAQWLSEHLPRAQLHVIADAAHAPFLSHANEFVELVTDFMHE